MHDLQWPHAKAKKKKNKSSSKPASPAPQRNFPRSPYYWRDKSTEKLNISYNSFNLSAKKKIYIYIIESNATGFWLYIRAMRCTVCYTLDLTYAATAIYTQHIRFMIVWYWYELHFILPGFLHCGLFCLSHGQARGFASPSRTTSSRLYIEICRARPERERAHVIGVIWNWCSLICSTHRIRFII